MPVAAAVAFGANTGDREGQIACALERLGGATKLVAVSPIYETAPMYVEDQPPFLNGAALIETELGPLALLGLLKRIEREVGRAPAERYGPREIDLDLVLYGALWLRSERKEVTLAVPHPRLAERRFVLQPLCDLGPELTVPGMGRLADLLCATESQAGAVRRVNDAVVPLPVH